MKKDAAFTAGYLQALVDIAYGADAVNGTLDKIADELTSRQRSRLPESAFALPGGRYPIHDLAHARNALARVSQHGSAGEQQAVRAKVYARYPELRERHEDK